MSRKLNTGKPEVLTCGIRSVYSPDQKERFMRDVGDALAAKTAEPKRLVIIDNWLCLDGHSIAPSFQTGFIKALAQGNDVVFVLLHPDSPLVRRRETTLEKSHPFIETAIMSSLNGLRQCYEAWLTKASIEEVKTSGKLTVYCLDSFMGFHQFRCPETDFLGICVATHTSIDVPQLDIPIGDTSMGRTLTDHAEWIVKRCALGTDSVEISMLPHAPETRDMKAKVSFLMKRAGKSDAISIEGLESHFLPSLATDLSDIIHSLNKQTDVVPGISQDMWKSLAVLAKRHIKQGR